MGLTTLFIVGDTHYGGIDIDPTHGDANARQVAALNALPGKEHPLGGTIQSPDAVIQIGDAVHEDTADTTAFAADYALDGSGNVRFPCYVIDGNHDQNQVRTLITGRHGSLTWGAKIGDVYIQAMTENYFGVNDTFPPAPAQIATVKALLLARPHDEHKILLVHRALTNTYPREWVGSGVEIYPTVFGTNDPGGTPTDSLTPLVDLLNSVPNLHILAHGHDHYAGSIGWTSPPYGVASGVKIVSPGSVAQAPLAEPYSTTYAESFLVLRIFRNDLTGSYRYDVASYRFGYDVNRVWDPDVWETVAGGDGLDPTAWEFGFFECAAKEISTQRWTPLVETTGGDVVADSVIIHGHYTGLATGTGVYLSVGLVSNGSAPAVGASVPNQLQGRVAYPSVSNQLQVATTGTGSFSAVFDMPSVSGGSGTGVLPIPSKHISVGLFNPATAYTAGTIVIDRIQLASEGKVI